MPDGGQMSNFKWDDPFFLDEQLTEDERMIKDTARDYAQDKLFSRVLQANRDEEFHPKL